MTGSRTPENLRGRLVRVRLGGIENQRTVAGLYIGLCRSVDHGPRKGLRALTVQLAGGADPKWWTRSTPSARYRGRRVRVELDQVVGLRWRGREVPLADWLGGGDRG